MIYQLCNRVLKGCREIQELCSGFWKSSVLFTANKLDIFTVISEKELSASEIAHKLNVPVKSLEKLLDACVAMGLLKKNKGYRNSDLSENFLVKGKDWYQGDIVAHWADMYAAGHFEHLDLSVETNEPVPSYMLHHESYDKNRNGLENWVLGMHNWAMAGHARLLANSINLKATRRLLDVGGGPGTYSIFFCEKYPELTAVILDDDEIIRITKRMIEQFQMFKRISCIEANFLTFHSDEKFDAILMSNVLHMGRIDFAEGMLKKAYEFLPEDGKLILQDWFLDSKKTSPTLSTLFSLHIMARPGGEVYSFDEIKELLVKIGFRGIKKIKLPSLWSVILCKK